MMEPLTQYSHAFVAVGGYAIVMLVLSLLSAGGRIKGQRSPSGLPIRNYDDPVYRRSRAFLNAQEAAGPFVLGLLACVLLGASPFWVNLLASVFLVARIAMAVVHIRTTIQSLRSVFWLIATVCTLGLAVLGIAAAF